jgi:hypothetical protein
VKIQPQWVVTAGKQTFNFVALSPDRYYRIFNILLTVHRVVILGK